MKAGAQVRIVAKIFENFIFKRQNFNFLIYYNLFCTFIISFFIFLIINCLF